MVFVLRSLVVGALLGGAFMGVVRRSSGDDRRGAAIGLVVAAAIYVGFGLHGASSTWIVVEWAGLAAFGILAWLGVRRSVTWLAAGWGLHMLWDGLLHLDGAGATFTPEWYVLLCLGFDGVVAVLLLTGRYTTRGNSP